MSGETIRVSIIVKLTIELLYLMCMKGKQMLVFYFTFVYFGQVAGPSVSSVSFVGFY